MKDEQQTADNADIVVIGGGPAGLMAAIAAAGAGRRVILLEQLDRPGLKLLATGGGRCNLTNTLPPEKFMARFGRQGRFMQPALAAMSSDGLRAFFDELGVPTHAPDGMHVYPQSNTAASVQSALLRRLHQLDVVVRTGVRVTDLWIDGGALRGVETEGGRVAAGRVVLVTGGRGYPPLGGAETGYTLARRGGHTILEPVPALAPLAVREDWPRRCAGVSLPLVRIWIDLPRQSREGVTGDMIFTHTGISGPVVLDISGDVSALLRKHETVPVRIDLAPGTTEAIWLERFDRWQETAGEKTMRLLLDRHLPRSLVAPLCLAAGVQPAIRPSQVTRPARQKLAKTLTALPLTITGTEGWNHAMVTRGGVSLKEIDPDTLASKRLPGLYLAGEVLDLDGPSGGFNLQWAFSSGHLAGSSASEPRA
jgi:predicted Rossmann fold flavoprotein